MQPRSRAHLLELAAVTACAAMFAATPFLSSGLAAQRPNPAELDERIYVPSPRAARMLVAGYNELGADLVWSRTLVYYGDSILGAKSFTDLDALVGLINALDPRFRRPYAWGGQAAAFRLGLIPQSAYWTSARILTRATHVFPNDWEFFWALGLRYYMDLSFGVPELRRGLRDLGVSYLERAMRMPDAPPNLGNLAVSLRTKLGQSEQAMRNLREMLMTTTDPEARGVLLAKYQAVAGKDAAAALVEAGESFRSEWQRELPYAPDSLFVIIGPSAELVTARDLARGDELRDLLVEDVIPKPAESAPEDHEGEMAP